MPLLLVEKGPDRGVSFTFKKKDECLVGREKACHLQLKDPMTSRRHFRIRGDGERFQLEDLGSRNGTYLNGKKVLEEFVQIEDKVQVGQTIISVLADSAARRKGPHTGKTIRGYLFQERLGRGGMGTVYKARQISLDRSVAVKILSPELTKDPAFVDLFFREARSAGRLAHPNVVQVYDVVEADGVYFYSMELIERGSVMDILTNEGPLSPRRALEIILDAARALEYAERSKVIHRDVKPDNLMITANGTVKICDLGIAKTFAEARQVNPAEGIAGSPHYMAPEQGAGQPIDHRADIYSLGVSLFEMLTGDTPFDGATQAELIAKHIRSKPPAIRSIRPEIPRSVARLVDRMMAKRPDDRFDSARDLAKESSRLIATLRGEGARPSTEVLPKPASPWLRIFLLVAVMSLWVVLAQFWSGSQLESARRATEGLHSEWRGHDFGEAASRFWKGRLAEARPLVERLMRSPDPDLAERARALLAEIERSEKVMKEFDLAWQATQKFRAEHADDLRGYKSMLDELRSRPLGRSALERKLRLSIEKDLARVRESLREEDEKVLTKARRIEGERESLARAIEDVNTRLEAGAFRGALSRVERLREELPSFGLECDLLERRVHDKAQEAYRSIESEVGRLRGKGMLDEAVTLLRGALADTPYEEIRRKVFALQGEIEVEAKEVTRREQAERDSGDRNRFDESRRLSKEEVRDLRIPEAIEILENGRNSLTGRAYRQNFDWRIAHLRRIQGVFDRIGRHVKSGEGRPLKTYHNKVQWRIRRVEKGGVVIRNDRSGEAELPKGWGWLGWKEIHRICRLIDEKLTARDRLNLYALCREFGATRPAETERKLALALLETKDDPEVRQAFHDYEKGKW
ncbi:MAG: protein kinase [Planctomycetota bacterium]|nr:protein kinase [Planctomycetota bacterium]